MPTPTTAMASTTTAASAPNIGNGFDAGNGNDDDPDFLGIFTSGTHPGLYL
jgi:hypothetical protein